MTFNACLVKHKYLIYADSWARTPILADVKKKVSISSQCRYTEVESSGKTVSGGAPRSCVNGRCGEMEMSEIEIKQEHQEEVDRNYKQFKELVPILIEKHRGQYTLLNGGEIVEIYATAADAMKTGQKFYDYGLFSIQKITVETEDLGYFSHAVYSRVV